MTEVHDSRRSIERTETPGMTGVTEMTSLADIVERYELAGPHATIVIDLAAPGHVGNDLSVRWHARRHELVHAGADETTLAHLDHAIDALQPRGATVLLTANAAGSAHCWLADRSVAPTAHVGDCPALLPAIDELADRSSSIAVLVDHIGADLYRMEHLDVVELTTVKGEHVQTHRHQGGDQAGHQRRADGVYQRNAQSIAAEISRQAASSGAHLIVLSGDAREVAAVEQHLDSHHLTVRVVHAGARHEPAAVERLRHAVCVQELADRERRGSDARSELRRSVAQHTLAVTGREPTTTAIREGRLATLLLDRSVLTSHADQTSHTGQTSHADQTHADLNSHADQAARDTLSFGGRVVVVDQLDSPDGFAGLLRYAVS